MNSVKYPNLIRLGTPVLVKNGIAGTDQCDCVIDNGAEYPSCPHDIRGPRGAEGVTGKT